MDLNRYNRFVTPVRGHRRWRCQIVNVCGSDSWSALILFYLTGRVHRKEVELCVSNRFVKPGRGHRRWRCLMANLYSSWLWLIWLSD